jgi:hypothetical protein
VHNSCRRGKRFDRACGSFCSQIVRTHPVNRFSNLPILKS